MTARFSLKSTKYARLHLRGRNQGVEMTDSHNTRQNQQKLRESEEMFREFLEHAPAAVAMFDREMRYVAVSRRWMENFNIRGEIIGRSHYEIFPEIPERWRETHRRSLAGAVEKSDEDRFDRADGSFVWVKWEARPWFDAAGEIGGIVIFSEDITARKRAEEALRESERQLRTLADTVPQLVWMAEADGNVFWYNQKWYEYTGTRAKEMVGWGWQSVHDPQILPKMLEQWRSSLATGKPFEMEFPLRGADGVFRWFLTRVNPLPDSQGRIVRWFGTSTDIEESRRARQVAEESSRLKDEFLATVSHELRTPLTSIVGWTSLLQSEELDEGTTSRAIQVVDRNARSLTELIENLLEVTRSQTGKIQLNLRDVELAPVIQAAVDAVVPAAEAKQIRLQAVLDPKAGSVTGDPDRLQQVVWNLLTNSIKFTAKGGRVQVSLQRLPSNVEISVSDTGSGISPEFLPFVFDRFRQADASSTRVHGGLGLGLSIVRHLTELHGGTVSAYSPGEDQGSTFVVRLPLNNEVEIGSKALPYPNTGCITVDSPHILQGVKVLVVDDEPDTLELLRMVLELRGASVVTENSAAQALERFKETAPDVLLSDIGLPGKDGFDFIREVRSLPPERGGRVPAVALTAYTRAEDRTTTLAAGFDMHIPKPVQPADVVAVVASLTARMSDR
jgi:PAS domain S-box-containing protein